MAQKTDIRLRRSDTAGKIPTSANLSDGELAINTNSGALYFKKSDGTIITAHDNTILHIDSDTTVDSETGTAPKIGIGTTSPSFKLDVVGDGRFSGQNNLLYLDSGATGSPQIQFRQGTNRKSYVRYENSRTTFDIVNEFGNVALWTGSSGSEIERLTVDTSGNVGIGTTSPSATYGGKVLHIENGNNSAIKIHDTTGAQLDIAVRADDVLIYEQDGYPIRFGINGTEGMRLTTTGLGVGTTSPARKLHVEADGQLVIAKFESGNAAGALIDIENDATLASNAGAYAGVRFYNDSGFEMALTHITESSGNGYVQIGTAWASGGEKLVVHSNGNVGIGTTSPDAQLEVENSGGTGRIAISGTTGANLQFRPNTSYTAGGNFGIYTTGLTSGTYESTMTIKGYGSGVNDVMTIKGLGNVGIGTTSPNCALHVNGQQLRIANGNPILTLQDTTDDDDHTIRFQDNGGTTRFSITSSLDTFNFITNGSRDIRFVPNDSEAVRITSTGNVGIGTDSPATNLEVSGSNPKLRITDTRDQTFTVGDIMSSIEFDSDDTSGGAGTSSEPRAAINMYAASTFGSSTGLEFRTKGDTTGYPVQQMVIDETGQVGIGTGAPQGTLHLRDTTARLYVQSNDGSSAHVTFGDATDLSRGGIEYTSTDDLVFSNNNFAERMRIRYTGDVGIGTSSPAAKLHVGPDVLLNTYTTDRTTLAVSDITDGAELILRGQSPRIWFDATSSGNGQMYMDSAELQIYSGRPGAVGTQRLNINSSGAITFNNAFTFPTTDGTSGQVLKTNGSGTITWADETGGGSAATSITDADLDTKIQVEESADEDVIRFDVAGSEVVTMTDDGVILNDGYNFEGDVIGATKFKAQAGEALTIGDVVYISGISGNTVIVSKADANDSSKMPAFGLAGSTVSLNAAVEIVTFGTLLGVDTSTPSFALGEELYVSTTAGALTNSAPTGSSSLIQKIGKVTRVDASAGSIKVMGAGRTNATPNLDEGRLFIGNSSNQSVQGDDTLYVDMANSRVGINTTSPGQELDVAGNIRVQNNAAFMGRNVAGASRSLVHLDSNNVLKIKGNDSEGSSNVISMIAGGDVGIGTTSPSGKLHIIHDDITDALLLETTEDSNSAGPVLTFKRNSASPADADYLGQLKFKGENDADQEVVYAKMTSKISDQTDGTEDGILEFAVRKAGSNNINMRLGPNSLQLINGTGLTVAGNTTITGNLTVDGTTTTLNTATLDVEDKNITLNYSSGDSSASADGAGITIQDAVDASTDATFNWNATNDRWEISHTLNLQDGDPITWGGNSIVQHTGSKTHIGDNTSSSVLTLTGGNVGILATSPQTGLQVAHDWVSDYGSINISSSQNALGGLGLRANNVYKGGLIYRDGTAGAYWELTAYGNEPLLFKTNNAERMRISNDGNVGIGDSTPSYKLDVSGSINAAYSGTNANVIGMHNSTSGEGWIRPFSNGGDFEFNVKYPGGDSDYIFYVNDSTELMRIKESGNVGIGTTSPSKTLDVNGSMKAFAFEASGSGNKVITIGSSNDGTYYNGLIVWNQYNTSQPAHRLTASSGGGSHYEYGRGKLSFIENQGSDITRMVIKQGNVGIGNDSPVAKLQVEEYGIDTTETSTSATTQVAIHTFAATDFRSARFTIQVTNSTDSTYHTSEILLVHDGTDAYITEFGEIHTGAAEEATFDADISSGNVRLLATPASTDSMEFKIVCHSVTV